MPVLVVGDFMDDTDEFVRLARTHSDGYPVYDRQQIDRRKGGAGAVAQMLDVLGVEVATYGQHLSRHRKHRVICAGRVIARLDEDLPVPHLKWAQTFSSRLSAEPSLIVVCDHAKNVITPEFWEWLVARYIGTRILVDPHKSRRLEFYRGAWAILPNREEADCLTLADAERLRFPSPAGAVKCDRDGVVAHWRQEVRHYPSHASRVVDACGAGDALLAGAVHSLLAGCDWLEAIAAGNELAGQKCGWWGAKLLPSHATPIPMVIKAGTR